MPAADDFFDQWDSITTSPREKCMYGNGDYVEK